jgi:hypothetical protein
VDDGGLSTRTHLVRTVSLYGSGALSHACNKRDPCNAVSSTVPGSAYAGCFRSSYVRSASVSLVSVHIVDQSIAYRHRHESQHARHQVPHVFVFYAQRQEEDL